jgi:hypothetical protein
MKITGTFLTTILAALLALPSTAEVEWQLSGYLGAESRWFPDDPLDSRQTRDLEGSLAFEPELYGESGDGNWAFMAKPFFRWDSADDERTHFDIREMYGHWRGKEWEIKGGISKVFWGVTESRHLVDIINQTDLIENIDGEDKLGQPMIQITRLLPVGTLDVFVLPGFRERTFPGEDGRLRPDIIVDTDRPIYESGSEEWHTDFAARFNAYVGPFDIGLSYFYGTSRDPLFTPDTRDGQTVLRPTYNLIHQGGFDFQYTTGSWLWKFEAIARSGSGQHYKAATGGFEYTFYGIFSTAWDIGVIAEYHYDSRGKDSPDPFNDDLFAGMRLSPNDEFDTAFLFGTVTDTHNGTSSIRFEFERRIAGSYKLVVEGQAFSNVDSLDPIRAFRQDSFLSIELRRYF